MRETKYVITYPEDLRSLCIRENWFTCGSNLQYEKLFWMNEHPEDCNLINMATVIWLCSDFDPDNYDENYFEIHKKLYQARENYLISLAEEYQAEQERAADEIYCSYFE